MMMVMSCWSVPIVGLISSLLFLIVKMMIYCIFGVPCCGLISESYFTEEVIELAMAMAKNIALNYFYDNIKKLERKTSSNGVIKINVGKRPMHEHENPLYTRIDELTEYYYKCCKRSAKISLLQKMSASFCPFCGVIDFENE